MCPMKLQCVSSGTTLQYLSNETSKCVQRNFNLYPMELKCFSNKTKMCSHWNSATVRIQINFKVCAKELQYVSNGIPMFVQWNFIMFPMDLQCFCNGSTICVSNKKRTLIKSSCDSQVYISNFGN